MNYDGIPRLVIKIIPQKYSKSYDTLFVTKEGVLHFIPKKKYMVTESPGIV